MPDPTTSAARQVISWRDTFSTWPSLTVTVEVLPWHWKVGLYRDDIEPYFIVSLGPVELKFSANRKPFALERVDA